MQIPSIGSLGSSLLDFLPNRQNRPDPLSPVPNEQQQLNGGDRGGERFPVSFSDDALILDLSIEASRTDFSFSGSGFQAQGFSESFELDATFQQGDQLLQLNVQITQSVVGIAFGQGLEQETGGSFLDDLLARLPEDALEQVLAFQQGETEPNFFSPEATAGRIADFALSGFSFFDGGSAAQENSVDSRQRFSDFIIPAIEQGFAEALEILGQLPTQVTDEIQQTRNLIDDRFAQFIGIDATA